MKPFNIIVTIPNVDNLGKFIEPTIIEVIGVAVSQFEYTFRIFKEFNNTLCEITGLYETLVGTAPDCDKRFTDAIEAHLEQYYPKPTPYLPFCTSPNYR